MEIVALVHQQNGTYGVTFPDLPGCVSVADSFEELLVMGAEALTLHLEGMVEDGDILPPFRDLATLERDPGLAEELSYAERATVYSVHIASNSVSIAPTARTHHVQHRTDAAE